MRAVLVGDARDRARLRQSLALSQIDIVGEAETLAAARTIASDVDAFVVAPAPSRRETTPAETLTPRELEVLQILAEGLSNKAIARRLGISDQTVKFHVASIGGKLGAQNRTEAVRIAIQRGLIEL
jgi:DNA-binding NarL/FixJ family response regulator